MESVRSLSVFSRKPNCVNPGAADCFCFEVNNQKQNRKHPPETLADCALKLVVSTCRHDCTNTYVLVAVLFGGEPGSFEHLVSLCKLFRKKVLILQFV